MIFSENRFPLFRIMLRAQAPGAADDTLMSVRAGGLSQLRNPGNQKIAHLRIVLKARFA
jgi:hypothetical protein